MKAPGPSTLEFSKGIGTETPLFFQQLQAKYGDIIRCKVPLARPIYLISHPDYAKYILSHHASNYARQDFISRRFRSLMGNGSVVAEGDLWARQRKIISPVFQRKFLKDAFQIIENQTNFLIERWKRKAAKGEPVEVVSEIKSLTLDMLWRILFHQPTKGTATEQAVYEPTELAQSYLGAPLPFFYPKWLPTFNNWGFFSALNRFENIVKEMVAERRKNIGQVDDMLDFLLRYKHPETGEGLSDKLIVEEIKTMTPAGFLTTTAAISWLFYELGKNPQHIAAINEEACSVLAKGKLDFRTLEQFKFTTNCQFEALRLYPTGWTIWRNAIGADEIGGYEIEPGATMIVSPFTTQRNASFWKQPDVFDPYRELVNATDYSFFPFGLGPRKCLGENLAMVEMLIIVPMIFKHFRFKLLNEEEISMDARVILTPKPGVRILLEQIK